MVNLVLRFLKAQVVVIKGRDTFAEDWARCNELKTLRILRVDVYLHAIEQLLRFNNCSDGGVKQSEASEFVGCFEMTTDLLQGLHWQCI